MTPAPDDTDVRPDQAPTDAPGVPPDQAPTDAPGVSPGQEPAGDEPPVATGLHRAIAAAAPRRWWNATTLGLLGLVLLAGGFLGGVQAHQRWGTGDPATAPGGAPGAAAPAGEIAGTVELVDGTTLHVRTATGETVTVRTGEGTAVTVAEPAGLDRITTGRRVTVRGAADAEGVVTATAVTAG